MNPLLIPLILAAAAAVCLLVWGLERRRDAQAWEELLFDYVRRVGHRAFPQYDTTATNNGGTSTPTSAADAAPAGPEPQAAAADPNGPPHKRIERWPL